MTKRHLQQVAPIDILLKERGDLFSIDSIHLGAGTAQQ